MKDALYLLNSYEKTKELSLLEKLQAIKEAFLDQNVSIEYKGKKVDFFKDIENALKDYEKILTAKECFKDTAYKISGLPLPQTMEDELKKLKALEIIKKKRVNVHLLILSDSLEKYNFNLLPYRKLTQEEFDLLKEVLE